ncbi:MAG: hypothetical protein QGF78_05855 [Candidatus Bathyarchaeota archaeon]|nr:hypothetical protein [Candidatus Bathyarchaeota archaeon]
MGTDIVVEFRIIPYFFILRNLLIIVSGETLRALAISPKLLGVSFSRTRRMLPS